MTWLKGTTTWANVVDVLTKLACGEMADGSSVTVDSAEQWVREIAGQDLLRTPASEDVATGTCHQRAGYFSLATMPPPASSVRSSFIFHKCVLRQTTLWSGVPSTISNNRWIMGVKVTTANSVSGNYSTARLAAILWDPDTNAIGQEILNQAPSSSGDVTMTFSTTKTISLNVSDPSGTLSVGMLWFRCFTNTYLGGIDYFGPMYERRTGNPTFSVNPPGSAGTDYDLNVAMSTPYNGGVIGSSQLYYYSGIGISPVPVGGMFSGVGIKTVTSLTGAQYSLSWNMALMKIRLVALSGASNGQITLDWGGGGLVDTATYRKLAGYSTLQWLRPYQTPGSVTSGSAIQYWMSVKRNRIMIILNADPAQTGKLTCNGVYKFTSLNVGGYDKFPVCYGHTVGDYTADFTTQHFNSACQFSLRGLALRQDDSEARDWQTRWIRGMEFVAPLGDTTSMYYDCSGFSISAPFSLGFNSMKTDVSSAITQNMIPARQTKPNAWDSKWWLWPTVLIDHPFSGTSQYVEQSDLSVVRGYIGGSGAIFHWLPSDGWASGDELTDNATSDKYFCVAADYLGLGARMRTSSNTFFGGYAIKEN